MATMSLPVAHMNYVAGAEKAVGRVNAWLVVSQAMNVVKQTCVSLVELTGAFHEAVNRQSELIATLTERASSSCAPGDLLAVAEDLEHLVSINHEVLAAADHVSFRLTWSGYLSELRKQAERLDSIAESFRMGADEEIVEEISALVASAENERGQATATSWREFVATLHD
jgi:hypothetical protein